MYVATGLRGCCASCRPAGRGLGAFDLSQVTFQDVLMVAMAGGLVYLSIPERKPKRRRAPKKKTAGGDWGDMGGGGFVGTLGPVLVLGVLGIVGYYVWQFGSNVAATMAAGVPSMIQAVP